MRLCQSATLCILVWTTEAWNIVSRRKYILQTCVNSGIPLAIGWTVSPSSSQATEFATAAGRSNCLTNTDPSRTVVTCTGNLLNIDSKKTNRLSSISSTENGVSTSAINNPLAYAPPWNFQTETSDSSVAWKSLEGVVQDLPDVSILNRTDTYLHATVPTVTPGFGVDDMEFVLRIEDNLVLYRSASRSSIFVYPLTRPVSDQNTNRKRMERIRATLGWQEFQ